MNKNNNRPSGLVLGGILILIGVIFLARNVTGWDLGNWNWWALFILIPALGSLANAWRIYQAQGRVTAAMAGSVRIQAEDFDAGVEVAALTQGRTDIGAVVTFTGLCRDEGGRLAALELEHYPGMAQAEAERVVEEARARWPLSDLLQDLLPEEHILLDVQLSSS